MTDRIIVEDDGLGVTLIEVGLQGLPGPPGPTAPVLMGTASMASVSDIAITLIASARYGFTIVGIYGLAVASGNTSLTIKVNNVPVNGLTDIAVGTTPQDVLATGNNVVAVGDKLSFVLSGGGSGTDFEFTMGAAPAE